MIDEIAPIFNVKKILSEVFVVLGIQEDQGKNVSKKKLKQAKVTFDKKFKENVTW